MQALMESCPGKTAVSGVMGFALGGAFGLFMASVRTRSFLSHHKVLPACPDIQNIDAI